MKRIDHSTATENNLFTDGNPAQGVPATVVPAEWLNIVQEEIANMVEAMGLELDGAAQNQLAQGFLAIFTSAHSWTKVQSYPQVDLTINAGSVVWDMAAAPNARLVLTEDVTSFTFTNPKPGTTPHLLLQQDATGGRLCPMPSGIRWVGTAMPEFTSAANGEDRLAFPIWDDNGTPVIQGNAGLNYGEV